MKKLLTSVLLIPACALVLSVIRQPSLASPVMDDAKEAEMMNRFSTYGTIIRLTHLGAIGQVISREWDEERNRNLFHVQVTTPLWGCTNSQVVAVMGEIGSHDPSPTNQSHIVFCAHTNAIWDVIIAAGSRVSPESWNTFITDPAFQWRKPELDFTLFHPTRSWWYVDDEGGIPTTYFTNFVQALRPAPNWTNYYEVIRSGLTNNVKRIKEDADADLRSFIYGVSEEQADYLNNDPLFPESHREILARVTLLHERRKEVAP